MFRLPWEKKPAFWTWLFVLLGIALRLFHYGRNPSMWHDEAALVLNATGKTFTELLGPLFFAEAAPPLFSWIERGVFLLLGDGTYALRLVPFMANCLSLVLLAVAARRMLTPEAVPWVVLPFACADTILWHACEAKPYSVDMLCATGLLTLYSYASSWKLIWQFAVYSVLAPVVVFISFPGCFLLGGLLVALLPVVWQGLAKTKPCSTERQSFTALLGYSLLVFMVLASFTLLLVGPIRAQRCGPMTECWLDLFAPWDKPWKVPFWAILSTIEVFHFACPPGGQPFAVLALIGGIYLARRGQWRLLCLLIIPPFLALLAACARAYPFGGARVMAYAVPGLLILIGAGTPLALAWARARSRAVTLVLLGILFVPAVSAAQHAIVPWGRADCAGAADYVLAHRQATDFVTGNTWECQYYFRHLGDGFAPLERVRVPLHGRLWVIVSGIPTEDRIKLVLPLTVGQGRITEQHGFERITLFLLEEAEPPITAEQALP
ncbi:MAG TPA: hypothetical protein VGY58_14060 [Gemmataceae bacterium]|nr:hypothetical protein [Gemmataceae bacterium]